MSSHCVNNMEIHLDMSRQIVIFPHTCRHCLDMTGECLFTDTSRICLDTSGHCTHMNTLYPNECIKIMVVKDKSIMCNLYKGLERHVSLCQLGDVIIFTSWQSDVYKSLVG